MIINIVKLNLITLEIKGRKISLLANTPVLEVMAITNMKCLLYIGSVVISLGVVI